MKIYLLILCVLFWFNDSCQQFQWISKIDGIYNQLPTGNRIATTPNGDSYVVGTYLNQTTIGTTVLTGNTIQAIYFAKYNSVGNVLWAKKITSSTMAWGNAISTDKQKSVYITGIFNNDATFETTTLTSSGTASLKADIFVAKYDSNGVFIWAKNFSGNGSTNAFSIRNDSLSNSYVSGYATATRTIGTAIFSGATNYMVLFKLDANGNVSWATKSNGTTSQVNAYDIAIDKNLNVYAFGHYGNVGSGGSQTIIFGTTTLTANSQTPDIFLAKYDNNGNSLSARKIIGNFQGDRGLGIAYDRHNHIYVTGGFEGSAIFDSDTVFASPPIAGKYNSFLAKFDLNLNCQWARRPDSVFTTQGFDVHVTTPNSIYFGGDALGMTLFKYDSLGNLKWQYRIKKLSGATGFSISSDKYGALYVKSSFSNTLATNIGTLSTGSSTLLNNFVAKIDSVLITSLKSEAKIVYEINIFPNPTKSTIYISSNTDEFFDSKVEISTIEGKILKSLPFSNEINVDDLMQGVYIISVTNCNSVIVTSKFIKIE